MEEDINSLYKVIDEATLAKNDLENQIETMKVELTDLDRKHEEVRGRVITSLGNLVRFKVMGRSCSTLWRPRFRSQNAELCLTCHYNDFALCLKGRTTVV